MIMTKRTREAMLAPRSGVSNSFTASLSTFAILMHCVLCARTLVYCARARGVGFCMPVPVPAGCAGVVRRWYSNNKFSFSFLCARYTWMRVATRNATLKLQEFYRYTTCALQSCYMRATVVLHARYMRATGVLHACYRRATSLLQEIENQFL